MIHYNSFFVLLLAAPLLTTAQTAEKTMIKSFNVSGKEQILLDLPGTVKIKTWEQPTLKIQITVSLPSGNAAILDELANVGRYNLTGKSDSSTLTISAEKMSKIVKVKGHELKENLTFQVFAPKDLLVKIFEPVTTAAVLKK